MLANPAPKDTNVTALAISRDAKCFSGHFFHARLVLLSSMQGAEEDAARWSGWAGKGLEYLICHRRLHMAPGEAVSSLDNKSVLAKLSMCNCLCDQKERGMTRVNLKLRELLLAL